MLNHFTTEHTESTEGINRTLATKRHEETQKNGIDIVPSCASLWRFLVSRQKEVLTAENAESSKNEHLAPRPPPRSARKRNASATKAEANVPKKHLRGPFFVAERANQEPSTIPTTRSR